MDQNILKLLPPEYQNLSQEMYEIILERALLKIYSNLPEEKRGLMAQIFDNGTEEEQLKFLNDYFGDLNKLILLEAQNLVAELKQKSAS